MRHGFPCGRESQDTARLRFRANRAVPIAQPFGSSLSSKAPVATAVTALALLPNAYAQDDAGPRGPSEEGGGLL